MRNNEEKNDLELDKAVMYLDQGGIISFPTETFYGLGVNPFNEKAVKRLFSIKGRDRNKPILLLAGDKGMLSQLVSGIPECYVPLMDKYWPGPLTLLFPAGKNVNQLLTGGTGMIGIRVSSDPIVKRLLSLWCKPVTATSANISGEPPAATAGDVARIFGCQIDHIIDGGATPAGLCSTIVGCEKGELTLVRKGKISFEEIVKLSHSKD